MSTDEILEDTTTCPMCGATIGARDRKCAACGENLTAADGESATSEGGLAEQEIRAFVGRRADYYLRNWKGALAGDGRGTGFNRAAFFLSGFWLPYRKMYFAAFVFYGIIVFESIVEEVVFVGILGKPETPVEIERLSAVAAAIVCGAFGNRWYLSRVRREITNLKSQGLPEEAILETLSRRGGTSIAASIGFFVLFMALIFVVAATFGMIFAGE